MAQNVGALTLEDFARRFAADGPFEVIGGEIVPVSPTVSGHSVVLKKLFAELLAYERQRERGEVFAETPFVVSDTPGWVRGARVPDLMWISADRLSAYKIENPDWTEKPFVLVPDAAIEIISPTDRYSDVQDKIDRYLRDGVTVVWLVDPRRESVTVYRSERYLTLSGDDSLAGDDVLPGFSLSVSAIFTGVSG